jgi:hypothetical protein
MAAALWLSAVLRIRAGSAKLANSLDFSFHLGFGQGRTGKDHQPIGDLE